MIEDQYVDSHSIKCPYCKNLEVWTGDPIGGDGDERQVGCSSCHKKYRVMVSISVTHHCYPVQEYMEEEDETS